MPIREVLEEREEQDARAICTQAEVLADHLKRLEALENWRAGVETLSARQWRLQLIAVSAALTVVGSLVVALILALARG